MTKSIKQLENNFKALDNKVIDLAEKLQDLYKDYLPHLIKVVQREIMVATYQICTQKYPEAFLHLSYGQRTKLQEKIKVLALEFPAQLINGFKQIDIIENLFVQNLHQEILAILPISEVSEKIEKEIVENEDNVQQEVMSKESNLKINSNFLQVKPEELINFQFNLDDSLEERLTDLSNKTNKSLQEVNILSDKIPNQILAIALEAEENTSIVSGAPNLLSLFIEKEPKSDELDLTPIVAICLRINDLEFHDSTLNLIKQKMTQILTQLSDLSEEYDQVQEEYAIAQAEVAWRASWYEE